LQPPTCDPLECEYCKEKETPTIDNNNVKVPVVKIKDNDWGGPPNGDRYITKDLMCEFVKMQTRADELGIKLQISSGFRSPKMQEKLFVKAACAAVGELAIITCPNGPFVEPPGQSEHGEGVSLDIVTNCTLCTKDCTREENPDPKCNTPEKKFLNAHAREYKFFATVDGSNNHYAYIIPPKKPGFFEEQRGPGAKPGPQPVRNSEAINANGVLVDISSLFLQGPPNKYVRFPEHYTCCCHADEGYFMKYGMQQITCVLLDEGDKVENAGWTTGWSSGCGYRKGPEWHDWYDMDNDWGSLTNWWGKSKYTNYNGYNRCVLYRHTSRTQQFLNHKKHVGRDCRDFNDCAKR